MVIVLVFFCFNCFPYSSFFFFFFFVLWFLYFYMCVFDCKCKSLKRLCENIKNKQQHKETEHKQQNNSKNNINTNRTTWFPAHEPLRTITISKGLAGRFLFSFMFLFLFMFSFELLCFLFYVFIGVFFDCKCKHLKRLGEHIKQTQK